MPRFPRSRLPDGYYHVTSRGAGGAHVFVVDLDRLDFLALLGATAQQRGWHVHAHCLMGTHYHLVVESTQQRLSDGMKRLNGVYALCFNRRHGRRGDLFGERFASYVLRDERHLQAATDYILQNPVKAGLCRNASEWPWAGAAAAR
jgi:putative transposase